MSHDSHVHDDTLYCSWSTTILSSVLPVSSTVATLESLSAALHFRHALTAVDRLSTLVARLALTSDPSVWLSIFLYTTFRGRFCSVHLRHDNLGLFLGAFPSCSFLRVAGRLWWRNTLISRYHFTRAVSKIQLLPAKYVVRIARVYV